MATIRDLMTSNVETVGPDHTARDAASFMLSADTGSIPVCENDKVIGMITDRDIAVRGVAAGKGPDCAVRDLMSDRHRLRARQRRCRRASPSQMSRRAGPPPARARRRATSLVGMVSLGDLGRETSGESAAPGARRRQRLGRPSPAISGDMKKARRVPSGPFFIGCSAAGLEPGDRLVDQLGIARRHRCARRSAWPQPRSPPARSWRAARRSRRVPRRRSWLRPSPGGARPAPRRRSRPWR